MADNTILNAGAGGDVIASDDIGGVKHQRVKIEYGADGSASDVSGSTPLPVFARNDGRTPVQYSAVAVAAGATAVETLISLVKGGTTGAAPGAAAGSQTVPAGKRFRITSITVAARGSATATAQATTFTLRINSGGATVAASNSSGVSIRVATPATALAWDRMTLSFGDDGPELIGDGTLSFGISASAVFVTNGPTWDVLITGHEFS